MACDPDVLDQLAERLDVLEKRVHWLEQHSVPAVEAASANPATRPAQAGSLNQAVQPGPSVKKAESTQMGGVLAIVGKSLLGIAGAYLLRALSSVGVIPRGIVIALAIVYATAWLLAATRVAGRHGLAGGLYAATSVLILGPMLWEMTLRFHAMPAWVAAVVLAAYGCVATVLSYRNSRSPLFSVAYAGTAVIALALLVGTHDMAPFAAILLAMLLICEVARLNERAGTVRLMVALAADLAVWIVLYIYRLPADARGDYPALSATAVLALPTLLFLIQSLAVLVHVGMRLRCIRSFDVAQSMVAFLLLSWGLTWLTPEFANPLLGSVCLALSAVCYSASFVLFAPLPRQRNFRIFSTWAAILLLGGTYLLVAPSRAAVFLGLAALAAILIADRLQSSTLEWHGLFFLVIATVTSGMIGYCMSALAGPIPDSPSWRILVVATCAVLACILSHEIASEPGQKQLLHLIPAFLAVGAVAAFLIRAAFGLAAMLVTPSAFHIALARTLVLSLLALGLAFAGGRLHRTQMVRVAYAATAFVAAKLLFEDLRHGRMEFIAASICLVAVTFIAVPRLARYRRVEPSP